MRIFFICCSIFVLSSSAAAQQAATQKPFEPVSGQPGKDVVWVPSPPDMVNKLMELGQVTSKDFVIDLGSGDGRNVIAAAKLGAQALGVEYNPDMVALSRKLAQDAGVGDKAQFVQADMYEYDISKATVMALFLLPDNLRKLSDKFLNLRPGSRLVLNTFAIPDWEADVSETIQGDCMSWCTSLLYFVPAKVAGTWKTPQGELALTQSFQNVTGTLTANGKSVPVTGKLRGETITLTAGGAQLAGKVLGDRIEGTNWSATRASR